jgi:hypothetical protein
MHGLHQPRASAPLRRSQRFFRKANVQFVGEVDPAWITRAYLSAPFHPEAA